MGELPDFPAIIAAVRGAHPDRAGAILAALEARLHAGPWSLELAKAFPATERGAGFSRDAMMREVSRALVHEDAASADARLLALERFLGVACFGLLAEILGAIDAGALGEEGTAASADAPYLHPAAALAAWAADALEAGFDSTSLRRLAGEARGHSEDAHATLRRALAERGRAAPDEDETLRAWGRRLCARMLSGRITLAAGGARIARVVGWTREGPLAAFRTIGYDLDVRGDDAAILAEIRDEATRILATAPTT
ncbi:MAG TPA: hypothetical protein VMV18_00570 [bacterium]|nr:hypothetical protein [bacterium]